MSRVLKCFFIGILSLVCCTSVTPLTKVAKLPQDAQTQPTRQGFENTTLDNDKYPCVIGLHRVNKSFVGSGVLITPYYILTAGHCIDGDDITEVHLFDGRVFCVRQLIHHPYYSIGKYVMNDIGIIALDEPILDVEIYDLCPDLLQMYKFQDIDLCGYGGSWKKQSEVGKFNFYGILIHEINEFKILPVDGSVWFGDSGGGAFATIGGKKYQIGIIRSFSAIRVRGAPTIIENSCVRVDRYLVWIRSIIKP